MRWFCMIDRATGLIESYQDQEFPEYDAVTHLQVAVEARPDPEAQCWDGRAGLRPFADGERKDLLAQVRANRAAREMSDAVVQTFTKMSWDFEQRLRALNAAPSSIGPLAGANTLADYRQAVRGHIRNLLDN